MTKHGKIYKAQKRLLQRNKTSRKIKEQVSNWMYHSLPQCARKKWILSGKDVNRAGLSLMRDLFSKRNDKCNIFFISTGINLHNLF